MVLYNFQNPTIAKIRSKEETEAAGIDRGSLREEIRGDASFAKPEIYECLEKKGFLYAIRLAVNEVRFLSTLFRSGLPCLGVHSQDIVQKGKSADRRQATQALMLPVMIIEVKPGAKPANTVA